MILQHQYSIENMEIVEVYVYFDRPLLFTCKDTFGHLFLAVLIDVDNGLEKWLYTEISDKRLQYIRSGGIDLHDAFAMSEAGYCFLLTNHPDKESEITLISSKDIPEDWLPLPGELIKIKTQTIKENEDVGRVRMDKTELDEVERLSSFEQRVIAAEERAEALKLENLNLEERAVEAEDENERLRATKEN
jgi:hypothetical protein